VIDRKVRSMHMKKNNRVAANVNVTHTGADVGEKVTTVKREQQTLPHIHIH